MDEPILRAARLAAEHHAQIRSLPVRGPAQGRDLAQHLEAAYSFDAPLEAREVLDDLAAMLRRGAVQVTHPAYFGLFNPSVRPEAIGAATLAAAFNPQCATFSHSPAAVSIEQHVLRWLMTRLGYAPETSEAHFTSGGQEANTEALLAALVTAFPAVRTEGVRALPGDPVLYASREAHHSLEKAAQVAGLGRAAVRRVDVAPHTLALSVEALETAIAEDRAAGRLPFLAVGTFGATASGAIDPLEAMAALCAREGLWLHADAAWGGSVVLSERLRPLARGLSRADSITWDAHKWLAVPFTAGMLFTRRPEALLAAFATESPYMPVPRPGRHDPFQASFAWTRRAAGLPLFAALATLGGPGYAEMIEGMTARGDELRARLRDAGYAILNETPLPLVCFTHPRLGGRKRSTAQVARALHQRGRAWISAVTLADGAHALRACITSYRTDARDLDALLEELEAALAETAP